jgi:hypothetical protein
LGFYFILSRNITIHNNCPLSGRRVNQFEIFFGIKKGIASGEYGDVMIAMEGSLYQQLVVTLTGNSESLFLT